jgi:hypothetical protein
MPEQASTRLCDVVMKGGITSGVVYPLAVAELAERFSFVNIGGTSAGAIAAAATAAAELRRRRGGADPDAGFCELRALPSFLGEGRNLVSLFEPQRATAPLLRLLLAALRRGSTAARVARTLARLVTGFPAPTLAGALPGLALAAIVWQTDAGAGSAVGLVLGLGVAAVGALAGASAGAILRLVKAVPSNCFGLSTGFVPDRRGCLASWLSDLLDRVAGQQASRPLTFGDLWSAPPAGSPPSAGTQRSINLEMVTTCLTLGRPFRLPLETGEFFFLPQEMARFFPERIVRFLVERSRGTADDRADPASDRVDPPGLLPLPEMADLPVVVAVRLSLSFPLLISAVPLWSIDRTRQAHREKDADGGRRLRAERCWFSDGGLCSNFPVHFFDQPLPRWPTFAFNLRRFHPDHPRSADERENVWMPETNTGGIEEWWDRFDTERGDLRRLTAFGAAILDTMQGWMDNLQMRGPGYRDRVVHVSHEEEEGGLNLDMPRETILALAERGRCAAALLRRRFAPEPDKAPHALSWDNHRWVRYRSALELIERMLRGLRRGYRSGPPELRSYQALADRGASSPPNSYRWARRAQAEFALEAADTLVHLAEEWAWRGESFAEGAPKPTPEIRILPRM